MTGVNDERDNRLGLKTSYEEIVSVIYFQTVTFYHQRDAKTNQD